MNALTPVEDKPRRQITEVRDPIPLLDTAQFEHMQRIASVMARSTLVPEALYMEGKKDDKQPLPYEQILSNCFLVVNQSVRWGMDPFAVAQCVSVVHGKLCYEGKLVSAVLDAKLGLRLHHHFTGEGEATRIYLSDREFDAETIAELKPGYRKTGWRLFDGSVAEWKTTGAGTPWSPKNYPRMLIYRGTRDWTRIYEPAIMLGVYTPDEMLDLAENARAMRATEVASRPAFQDRLAAAKAAPALTDAREGFDASFVARETESLSTGQEINHEPGSGEPSPPQPSEPVTSASGQEPQPLPDGVSNPAEQPVGAGAEGQEQSAPAPAPDEFTAEEWKWVRYATRRLWTATGKGEQQLVEDVATAIRETETPPEIGEAARAKAGAIKKQCKLVCFGEIEHAGGRKLVAALAGVTEDELREVEP